jgi:ribonucleotide monophosphatase NagD (HAD superfamily)
MVGGRPDTDIRGALALGMKTALVRSGRFGPQAVLPAGMQPDWDCPDLPTLQRQWSEAFGFG